MEQENPGAWFRILEHPADVGIEAHAGSLGAVFEECAKALVSIIMDATTLRDTHVKTVSVSAADRDQLLVKWLEEILYLYDGQGFVLKDPVVNEITGSGLNATLKGDMIDSDRHTMRLDVKAITYHQLSIRESNNGFIAKVFLDI